MFLRLESFAGVRFGTVENPVCTTAVDFDRVRHWPMTMEALKIAPTGRKPPNLWAAMDARPMEAKHPHDAQAGFPPNWHGVIFVCRSAERVWVVSANTQSFGFCGGVAN